jgi:Rod binding domain-containing protein
MTEPIHAATPDLAALVQTPPALAARAGAPPAALEKAAKGFESVLLNTLLQEMGKTVEPAGVLDNGTTQQVQGIFWMYLSQDLGNRGGLGLWKDLLRHMPNAAGASRGEGVPPSRAEGILPSVASSSSSDVAASSAASASLRKMRAETEEERGQDARETRGRDALATPASEPNR